MFGLRNFETPALFLPLSRLPIRDQFHIFRKTRLRTRDAAFYFLLLLFLLSYFVNWLNKNERDKVTPRAMSSENSTL